MGKSYKDPTFDSAWSHIQRGLLKQDYERLKRAVRQVKQTCREYGFDIVGKIVLKSRNTGRMYEREDKHV